MHYHETVHKESSTSMSYQKVAVEHEMKRMLNVFQHNCSTISKTKLRLHIYG
jgi:hypothetical protein